MYWFTRLRIVRGDGGGRSTDGAAGSKAVVCAEFEMTTVLAICASLAGANFPYEVILYFRNGHNSRHVGF